MPSCKLFWFQNINILLGEILHKATHNSSSFLILVPCISHRMPGSETNYSIWRSITIRRVKMSWGHKSVMIRGWSWRESVLWLCYHSIHCVLMFHTCKSVNMTCQTLQLTQQTGLVYIKRDPKKDVYTFQHNNMLNKWCNNKFIHT